MSGKMDPAKLGVDEEERNEKKLWEGGDVGGKGEEGAGMRMKMNNGVLNLGWMRAFVQVLELLRLRQIRLGLHLLCLLWEIRYPAVLYLYCPRRRQMDLSQACHL
jgi:hypothetical protein